MALHTKLCGSSLPPVSLSAMAFCHRTLAHHRPRSCDHQLSSPGLMASHEAIQSRCTRRVHLPSRPRMRTVRSTWHGSYRLVMYVSPSWLEPFWLMFCQGGTSPFMSVTCTLSGARRSYIARAPYTPKTQVCTADRKST